MTVLRGATSREVYIPSHSQTRLGLKIDVNDETIHTQVSGFDNMERAFALIPTDVGGAVQWQRYDLSYSATHRMGSTPRDWDDMHVAWLDVSPATIALIRLHGVAFGLDTNQGILWAQDFANNAKPHS
jgi:hypothetical protein